MKENFRIISKACFLLVIIGFFMPIACDMNGFKLTKHMMDGNAFDGIMLILMFVLAIIGLITGLLLLSKKYLKPAVDWILIAGCIISGLKVYLSQLKDGPELQQGAYVILTGWILTLALQIVSHVQKE